MPLQPTHTQMGLEFRAARNGTCLPGQSPMTQSELCELSGVARESTISRLENGYRPNRSTHGWVLGAINRRRAQLGLVPVAIEYLSDAERGVRAPAVQPDLQDGYWVEKIRCERTECIHYSLALLYQNQGRWRLTGWSSLGAHEEWYSNGYHFDDTGRNFYYTYERGRGLSRRGAIGGFGGVCLSPAKTGDKVVPVSGWFVNLEGRRADVFQCRFLTLDEAARDVGLSAGPPADQLSEAAVRDAFLEKLVARQRRNRSKEQMIAKE